MSLFASVPVTNLVTAGVLNLNLIYIQQLAKSILVETSPQYYLFKSSSRKLCPEIDQGSIVRKLSYQGSYIRANSMRSSGVNH